jgi:hypothetical protein
MEGWALSASINTASFTFFPSDMFLLLLFYFDLDNPQATFRTALSPRLCRQNDVHFITARMTWQNP